MRLVFYFENHVIGGGSKYVLDCINSMVTRGNEVTLLSNQGALSACELNQLKGSLALRSVRVFERTHSVARLLGHGAVAAIIRKFLVVFAPLFLLFNIVEIWRRLGSLRPDVLVACNGGYPASEPALAAVLAARLRKLPSVLVVMSAPRPRRRILPGYDQLLDRLVFSVVDIVVLNSTVQSRMLVKLRGASAKRIRTLYNGIPDVLTQRRAEPLTRADIILGVVCRLDPMKGLDHLIRALALLPERITLRIVGDGECREALQQLAQTQGVGERVFFAGHKQGRDLLDELDGFDIYVFPSLWEGLPYSLLEAMRAGLPIVSTNVGGIPEAIGDGKEGLLVPPASSQALADAINILLLDHERARRFAIAARIRYEELFSLNKMEESFSQIITKVKIKDKIFDNQF
jgi:glycosyltransferase involved in cell wall biosynthesis